MLFAVQAIGSVLWAIILPQFKNRKFGYALSLILGGIGFAMTAFVHDQYVMFIPFILIGCAWAAMLAMPFTFVTNALEGYGHMGSISWTFQWNHMYPTDYRSLVGGTLLSMVGSVQSNMMIIAGIALVLGALSVTIINDRHTTE